jgi:molybdopterin-biosynthesis enzyme MoeA-like protein
MAPQVLRTAAALIIGNEILSGKVAEANVVELARTLRLMGVRLCRVLMVEDDLAVIAEELSRLRQTYNVVFTSGGVGPTHDDMTIEAVARSFGVAVVEDAKTRALIEHIYGERTTPGHLRMARIPEGACQLTLPDMPWPTTMIGNVWVLPGVPEVFRSKLAVVRTCLTGGHCFHTRTAYLTVDEPELVALLDQLVLAHPEVLIGSYPVWSNPEYRTRITFDGADRDQVQTACDDLTSQLTSAQLLRVE